MKRTKTTLPAKMKSSISKEKADSSRVFLKPEGNTEQMISTGSTLLDLAISGGRVRGGGLPGGIMVEIFGPSGSGKTVLLCEIAGDVQRKNGDVFFHDPEARLNKQFAAMFDLDTTTMNYSTPDTIPEVFKSIREWNPKNSGKLNAIVADSLAALSTNLEMDNDSGDKMGMRRAKEFSEELRKTARILTKNNYLLVTSNQVRINTDAGQWGQKYVSPGGEAIGFYSSVRLRISLLEKIKKIVKIGGKDVKKIVGITSHVIVHKNSVWAPYREADVSIIFDYGVDDIRENLKFIKKYKGGSWYTLNGENLSNSLEKAIRIVEHKELVDALREEVIDLWLEIEKKFESGRKKRR